jgi:Glycosyl hydrolases family 38 N-terminal domain/Glycosyl hydrolases family 38 C-terminal domain/Alpha mannosidase middle domain
LATVVHLVPHTHWDREWYLPFQSFRLKLVPLFDRILELLEADSRFVFTLDGQVATIDDYLEVRPDAEEQIRRFVEEGRLAVGPWQTLMDEFLVSGESIIRNLEQGLRRGDELGGAMRIGYLPDMFGHIAQMPQILRLAGIEQAVVWRGVPAAIDRHTFSWEGLDGSSVRAEYMPRGYGSGADLAAAGQMAVQAEALHDSMRPFYGDDPPLAMFGNDHTEPIPELAVLVEAANERPEQLRVELKTLPAALEDIDGADLPHWRGELRSGARANLLMGVTSARIDLKAACGRAERALERYAEPLQALYGESRPESLLAIAWRRVLENAAHDSICGCSADEVGAQVLVRYAEAEQIAGGLAEQAVSVIARGVDATSIVVVNPSPHTRTGLVEVALSIPDEWDEVGFLLPDGSVKGSQRTDVGLVAQIPAPPLGWTTASPVQAAGSIENPVGRLGRGLANGLLQVEVAKDGTLRLQGGARELAGAGRLVAGGDAGDTYNYAPPADDALVEEPTGTQVEVVSAGPVRGELAIVRTYRWQEREVEVTTSVELRAGEPFVRVRVSFDNQCADHRLRFHVPLPEQAEVSAAEGQFAVVERGLVAEGGHGEVPLPTYPARGFVDAGGVAVLLAHVMEYELVEDGRELALTLLRSVGLLSRAQHPYRKVPAGPELLVPAAQLHGPWEVGFALYPHAGSWQEAGVLEQMERYQHPFLTAVGTGQDLAPAQRAGLELRGEGVLLTALRRRGDLLEARLVCERPEPCSATLVVEGHERDVELRPWEIRAVEVTGA